MSQVIQHDPVDVVLLGMGAMSSAPMIELSLAGYKVVALERGPYWNFASDYFNDKYDEWGVGFLRKFDWNPSISTASWRNNRLQFALPIRRYTFPSHSAQYQSEGYGVGGMTNHYGGMMGRFTPWVYQMYTKTVNRYGLDFLNAAVPHQDIIDWPMPYEDYVPYYETWEKAFGVCGTDQGPLLPGFENYKYPLPPSPPTPYGDLFKTAAESLGYHPFPIPHSLASKSFTNQYGVSTQECFYDGWCGGLCNYTCESGAKANPGWRTVPAALKTGNFDLRTFCYISRLETDSTGKATAARYYDAQGNVNVQPGKVFFNGLWGFNFIRMMLLSGIGPPYDPINIKGTVGRGPAFGVSGAKAREAKGTLDNMGANGYTCGNAFGGGYSMLDLSDDYFDHTGLDFIGGAYVSVGTYLGGGAGSDGGPNNWALFAYTSESPSPLPDMIGSKWKASVKDHFVPSKLKMTFQPYGIWPPTTDWFIDLDPHYADIYGDPIARITLNYGFTTVKAANYLAPFYADILKKMGASNVTVTDPVTYESHAVSYPAHIRGGARVGNDSNLAVFNKWQQCWTCENFFGAGEVTEPTGSNTTVGGTHPAGAGSYVAADGIKKYLQNPGPLT